MNNRIRQNATMATVLFVGLGIFGPACFALQIAAGPYLQCPGESSMTIQWITDKDCTSWIEYGTGEVPDQKAVSGQYGLIDAGQRIHRITLSGLKR